MEPGIKIPSKPPATLTPGIVLIVSWDGSLAPRYIEIVTGDQTKVLLP